ncbi:MAG: DNA helicase RecQ [Gammaproteobacteria bacterium]|nr:DNA helicase RecQ [Gammaproteobacteria bacterium]
MDSRQATLLPRAPASGADASPMDRARRLLREVYGYADFRPGQEPVVQTAFAGRDALVLMPTGGGKSLCYQLPAMAKEGVGIVVSPLIALMQDQVSALRQLGVKAAFLNSTLDYWERQEVEGALSRGALDLIYLAPERLLQAETLDFLRTVQVALIAIDEAHCVSQWGHDFRQDYLGLNVLADAFPGIPRMALTATADERTRKEIVARLALRRPASFVHGFDRPNIRYTVQAKNRPQTQLAAFLEEHRGEAGIVYCLSRRKVESTAATLREAGHDALPYHAGLPGHLRAANQARFLRDDGVVVVATIAFGMGIDKPDVRFVAHVDLPKSIEAYYQETGRAGRDDVAAEAWMIYGLQDVVRLRQMLDESEAPEEQRRIERAKLDKLLAWCEVTACRRAALLSHFGEDYPAPCGNCDICLDPPRTWDGTVAAQKLLSCVVRTGQRFGAAHVIDVLRGKATAKIEQHRHAGLSTYGIGDDLTEGQWRSVLRQLLVQGYVRADAHRYGALVLEPAARPLLRGEVTLKLREEIRTAKPKRARKTGPHDIEVAAADEPLWEAMRTLRKQLADDAGVPPYVVFHDATLKALIDAKPKSLEEMLALHGIGKAKLERYGDAFLALLASGTNTQEHDEP